MTRQLLLDLLTNEYGARRPTLSPIYEHPTSAIYRVDAGGVPPWMLRLQGVPSIDMNPYPRAVTTLAAFLARQAVAATLRDTGGGPQVTEIAAFLSCEPLPDSLIEHVRGVRGIILRRDEVLVLTDGAEAHVMPGGRREQGETPEATLHREVFEETGWVLQDVRLLGLVHIRHLGPWHEGHGYPVPEFLWALYVGEAIAHWPGGMIAADAAREPSSFRPLAEILALPLERFHQRLFLNAALGDRISPSPIQARARPVVIGGA